MVSGNHSKFAIAREIFILDDNTYVKCEGILSNGFDTINVKQITRVTLSMVRDWLDAKMQVAHDLEAKMVTNNTSLDVLGRVEELFKLDNGIKEKWESLGLES